MILPRGGKGPLHELLAEPGLWSRVQTALDETGLFLDGIGNCIIDDPANVHPYGMGMSPEPDDLRDYFEFAGKHELGGCRPASGPQIRTWQWSGLTTCALFAESMD